MRRCSSGHTFVLGERLALGTRVERWKITLVFVGVAAAEHTVVGLLVLLWLAYREGHDWKIIARRKGVVRRGVDVKVEAVDLV